MTEQINPWIVQPSQQQQGQVPKGRYLASFLGVEEVTINGSVKWRFAWRVKNGPETNKIASALCDRNIKTSTLPGVLIAGLLGRDLVAGENVKDAIEQCKGKTYLIEVKDGPKGGKPAVRSVLIPPQM